MTKAGPAIKIDRLTKKYTKSSQPAVDDLSLTVNKGEVYGFLGPNGAGKSTVIRILLNFLQPTSGQAFINSLSVTADSLMIRKSIGYLSGDHAMYTKMTGRQYLNYLADLQGKGLSKEIDALAERLTANLDKKIGELSRGNRQKIAIIQAFMHSPDILILDEPTSGLDPLVQETFHQLVIEAKTRGATVFMSSHVLSEVQKMCDRVGIIKDGKLVSESAIAELATESAQTFDIVFADTAPTDKLRRLKTGKVISQNGKSVVLHMNGELSELFAVLAKEKVLKIDARNLDLEDTFMQYYKNDGDSK